MDQIEHQVAIVGAGPTGLALGAELRRLGIPSLILDRLPSGENTSRAAVIHARTLEVLEPLGVIPELHRYGLIVRIFCLRDRKRILIKVNFGDLDTPYPYTLMCPQDRTESILLGRLQSLGGEVQRPCEVVSVIPAENHVQVEFKSGEVLVNTRAKWLVGCDGMHSIVREQASIPFKGGAYEESFVLADVEMDWPLDREEVNLFVSEKGLLVVAPLPGDYHYRIVATVKEAPHIPSISDVQQILDERGPENAGVRMRRLVWGSRFHVHHRLARALRRGRILLAGDAAHVHSPAGGQGMNTGIQDAISLASALKDAIEHQSEEALDIWEEKRLEIARSVVEMTDRMTKIATASSPVAQHLRNAIIGIIGHIPFAQHAVAEKLSELNNK